MIKKPYVVLVDLDGTVCKHDHRVHLAQQGKWEEFHDQLESDGVHQDVLALLDMIGDRAHIIAVTGRNERYRQRTLNWMMMRLVIVDELLMRPDHDFQSDTIVKPQLVYDRFGGKEKALSAVTFILDDREKVVEAWRDAGFNCWAVRPGAF